MFKKVENLRGFLSQFTELIKVVKQCSPVIFRKTFRDNLENALPDVYKQLGRCSEFKELDYPEEFPEMQEAGLSGPQLTLKLESFSSSLLAFDENASQDDLADTLGKSGSVLKSLAGAIPGFGSFAQELVDFMLKELKKRLGI